MRLFNEVIFDGNIDNTVVYNDQKFNALLGSCETAVVHVFCTAPSTTAPVLTITKYLSNDNVNWSPYTTANIVAGITMTTGLNIIGYDVPTSSQAQSAFVRYAMSTGASTQFAHVKVMVCGRGQQIVS